MSSPNLALPEIGGRARPAPTSAATAIKRLAWVGAILLLLIALIAPALWNGFPLIFADTGGYVLRPFEGTLANGRSALYGTFLAAGIPLEFWPNVLVQAALAIWIIALVLRTHLGELRISTFVLVVLGLACLTSLPWTASQLIPDVFVLLAALALHLLAFRPTALSRAEIVGLGAVIAFGIASHMSILGLAIALIAACAATRLAATRLELPSSHLTAPAIALCAGIGLALTSNAIIGGQFAFTPGGPNFLFARLVQDGLVQRYLARACPDPGLRICAYRDELPTSTEDWLWWSDSPFYKLGGWEEFTPEAKRIISGTLRTDPGMHIYTAARDTLQQLVAVRTGDGISPENNQHADWAMSVVAPNAMPHFEAAAQQRDELHFRVINWVERALALLATAAVPIILLAFRRRAPLVAALALSATVALVANAAICGIFSSINGRYQSRLVPMAALTVMIAGIDAARRRNPRQEPVGQAS